jgi:hypothetical protein
MGDAGAWGGKPIVSEKDWRKGTEYGGVEGMIQPLDSPHGNHVTEDEQLQIIYNTEMTYDVGTKIYDGEGPVYPVKKLAD